MAKETNDKEQEAVDNTAEQVQEEQENKEQEVSCEELVQAEKDRYLRLFAEFENFKKRTAKERIEQFKTANQDVLSALLPIVDDFDRGLVELKKSSENQAVFQGMELIYDKFVKTLDQKGLLAMQVQAGDTFDADLHEAVTQIPAPTDDLKGKIIDVIEKGYQLGDKIIRYPKVVIGQS
ncbi:nucleotide exchange factor GrpE [Flavobacteriaceae bacterium]|nr:nucleotide exchange factor GrpE [Flavobacteriaceae bacterium]